MNEQKKLKVGWLARRREQRRAKRERAIERKAAERDHAPSAGGLSSGFVGDGGGWGATVAAAVTGAAAGVDPRFG